MFSKMLNEMGGELGIILFTECPKSQQENVIQSVNVLTGIAIPQPDSNSNSSPIHVLIMPMLIKPLPVTVMPW